ncbi:MAG TPA: DUF2505 domain-containing protein [Pseudonocardiaceae bacterium]|jgi:hypothetical protein|nr:DUF2505 domain-containing protein [Pseudonocardiaceae bacterium]
MARRIEHRSRSTWDAKTVYKALVDPAYLRDRLAAIGGKGAELVNRRSTADQVEFQLRHGVAAGDLPAAVRTLLGGDLTIDRRETWRPGPDGGYVGTVEVTIPGMPGDLSGTQLLRDLDGGGSELVVDGTVRVSIPLFGGKIEESVTDQISKLLDSEHEFTQEWLGRHDS